MKPQQLSTPGVASEPLVETPEDCARAMLQTLTAVAVAIASSVVLMLGGRAGSAGIVSIAQPTAPVSIGIGIGADSATPAVSIDW